MACNSCAKPYSLLRKEKGCPNYGFGYCSKCLNNKIFVPKLNTEAKVCGKCKKLLESKEPHKVIPPDAYFKRLGMAGNSGTSTVDGKDSTSTTTTNRSTDQEILERLKKLKEDSKAVRPGTIQDIEARLRKIKGDIPKTTDEELRERLARLRGVPVTTVQTSKIQLISEKRTEQEQTVDLLKQYMAQSEIDTKYKDEFNSLISDVESRLNKLKGASSNPSEAGQSKSSPEDHSEDEEDAVRKIVERIKAEAAIEDYELAPSTNDELPFCEICNDDATLRCLGCRYLFCRRCFLDHKDDDDGCDRCEPYTPPKNK